MRKIYLSAGHSTDPNEDRGVVISAEGKTYVEGLFTAELVKRISNIYQMKFGNKSDFIFDNGSTVLNEVLRLFKRFVLPSDIACEIHFNAASNNLASGVEVLIPAVYTHYEKELAKELSKEISSVLGINDRGVKTELDSGRKKLGWMTLTCENVLIEVCFLSNPTDRKLYTEKIDLVASAIATILKKYKDL